MDLQIKEAKVQQLAEGRKNLSEEQKALATEQDRLKAENDFAKSKLAMSKATMASKDEEIHAIERAITMERSYAESQARPYQEKAAYLKVEEDKIKANSDALKEQIDILNRAAAAYKTMASGGSAEVPKEVGQQFEQSLAEINQSVKAVNILLDEMSNLESAAKRSTVEYSKWMDAIRSAADELREAAKAEENIATKAEIASGVEKLSKGFVNDLANAKKRYTILQEQEKALDHEILELKAQQAKVEWSIKNASENGASDAEKEKLTLVREYKENGYGWGNE